MIANFFNKTKPAIIFIVVLLLFVFYTIAAFLFELLGSTVLDYFKTIGFFFWLVLFLLILNFIVQRNKLTQDNSYALLITVLLLAIFYEAMFNSSILYANIALLLAFRRIYSLGLASNTQKKLFDSGFWIGVSALFYSWSLLYVALVYVSIIIFQRLSFKNLIIPLVGLCTPVLIYFSYMLTIEEMSVFYSRFIFEPNLVFNSYNSFKLLIPITVLITVLLWSVFSVTPKIIAISNKLKFSWNVLINHIIISLLIVFVAPVKNGSELFFVVFPAGILIANFLQKSESKNFKNLVLYLFLILAVSVYFL